MRLLAWVCLLAAMTRDDTWAAEFSARIWILPFENQQDESTRDYLREAVPALLAEAISRSGEYRLVDRQQIDTVLAEHALSLSGAVSEESRLRVGKMLGATMILTGSVSEHEQELLITSRVSDLGTGIVKATAEARGPSIQLGQLIARLYEQLGSGLKNRLPELAPEAIDEAPLSNLHFMKGLGHYFSARYNQALAEFVLAGQGKPLSNISRLWIANAYLAEQQYAHAYLELSRLKDFRESEVAAKKSVCERNLDAEDIKAIRGLAARRSE